VEWRIHWVTANEQKWPLSCSTQIALVAKYKVVLQRLIAQYRPDTVIARGGQNGADESFNKACQRLGVAVDPKTSTFSPRRPQNPLIDDR
jgi:hypothetical protein